MDDRPFFVRNPKWQIVLVLIFCLLLYAAFTERLGGIQNNRLAIAVDYLLLAAGLIFWPLFFAQLVLPVRTLTERLLVFVHLIRYLLGEHGPALRVEEGRVLQRANEQGRKGHGVLLVDPASAAVLRTAVSFTRTVGPGVYFLNYSARRRATERIAGAVSLRMQTRRIGPQEGEDPFVPRARDESEESYQNRQNRRWETSGLTRDGLEVVPNMITAFRLETRLGEGGVGFGYNPVAVWRAITGSGVDPTIPPDDSRRVVSWDWLPASMAADVWREYLRMFTMDELFQEAYEGRTALEIITEMVRLRLTQAKVPGLNEFGRPTGRMVTSPEFTLLLRRGLRVLSVAVVNLRLPASVEEQLTRRWQSTWLLRARQERDQLELERSYAKEAGQRQALMDFALAASQYVGELGQGHTAGGSDLLKMLSEGTLMLTVRDPQLHQRIGLEKNELVDLIGWVQQKP